MSSATNALASGSSNPYRLLYRGALSLPDSDLLLDGLTFASSGLSGNLLENPLALALESMRGRPSLKFIKTVRLSEIRMDTSGDVSMDIHPCATLSHVYFQNMFCLAPVVSPDGRSEYGVQVALGDNEGLETTNIIIYGQISTNAVPGVLTLFVGRTVPHPTTHARAPRPDDPTPRKPPLATGVKRPRSPLDHVKAKGRQGKDKVVEDERVKTAREVMLYGASSRIPAKRKGRDDAVFKIPPLPTKSTRSEQTKGKRKVIEPQWDHSGTDATVDAGSGGTSIVVNAEELEQLNRTIVKKTAARLLAASGIEKENTEFKELFGFVYRGTAFALRSQISIRKLNERTVDKIAQAHIKLYAPDQLAA